MSSKTKTVRDLGIVDVSSITKDILMIPESVWEEENNNKPNKFAVLDATKHIVFKFVSKLDSPSSMFELPIWNKWKSILLPVLKQAVKPYEYRNGEFSRIMLAKLPAGCEIKEHRDGGVGETSPHKIHIPITTNLKAKFSVDDIKYHFEVGRAYEVNNATIHSAINLGEEDRIHLIFEYFNNSIKKINR